MKLIKRNGNASNGNSVFFFKTSPSKSKLRCRFERENAKKKKKKESSNTIDVNRYDLWRFVLAIVSMIVGKRGKINTFGKQPGEKEPKPNR